MDEMEDSHLEGMYRNLEYVVLWDLEGSNQEQSPLVFLLLKTGPLRTVALN